MTPSQRRRDGTVDVPWVAAHAGDPAIRVVEVDVSRVAYDQGHIPGATHWDAYIDLRDAAYQPVQPLDLQQLFSRSGITPETTIVFYGYAAQLGFWLARAHSHRDVRMLIGPREQWTAGGQRWTAELPKLEESAYPLPIVDADIFASRDTVESAIDRPGQLILDVRSQAEFSGERFWPSGATAGAGRPGHIPGAINVPIDALRGADGTPKTPEELRSIFEGAGVTKDRSVITYCTIGNRASEAWFELKYQLGYPDVRVYYESWAVWGKLPETSIATS
jgi:thiosulfate/3-mercaptopyruvate sulfurtransferase